MAGWLVVSLVACFSVTASAGLRVYEGFDTPVNEIDGSAGDTSFGWAADSEWENGNKVAGLTMGDLVVSDGAASRTGGFAFRPLGTDTPPDGGTVYGSYLVRLDDYAEANAQRTGMIIDAESAKAPAPADVSWMQDRAGSPTPNYLMTAIQWTHDDNVHSSQVVNADTTYLVLWKLTGVAANAESTHDVTATMWILNEAQFIAQRGEGGTYLSLDEGTLDGLDIGHASTEIVSRLTTSSEAVNMQLAGSFINLLSDQGATFDEVRLAWDDGASLDTVTPIPEPGTLGLALLGVLAFPLRRRLMKAS